MDAIKKTVLISIACISMLLLTLTTSDLQAQLIPGKKVAVGFNAGTTGFGGEVTTSLTNKINLRLAYNTLNFSESGVYDDDDPSIGYTGNLSQTNFSLLADYYPINRGFKFTAGLYLQNFDITANATPNESYFLNEGQDNEKEFGPERLGSLDVLVTYPNSVMPYLGVGFGNPLAKGLPVKLNMSLGLMYSGVPELTMTGAGLISPTTDQAINFQEGLNEFAWFPVFKLGLSFRVIK